MSNNIVPLTKEVDTNIFSLVELDNCNSILGRICDYLLAALKINPLMLNGDCSLTIDANHLEYLFDIINEGRQQSEVLRYEIYRETNETNVNIEFISFDKLVLSFDYLNNNYFFIFTDKFTSIDEFSKEYQSINSQVLMEHKTKFNVFPCVISLIIEGELNGQD